MTNQEKKNKIKSLVEDMLNESHKEMIKKIDKVLNSGAIDVDGWDPNNSPMRLPKCIIAAIIQSESTRYEAKGTGTSYEKQVKKEVANIRKFI